MNNISETKPVRNGTKNNKLSVINSYCIVCNSPFSKARAGKLYCSNRCKQFGYNHKNLRTENVISKSEPGDSDIKKKRINISQYFYYKEMTEKVKRYKELSKRKYRFEEEYNKIKMRDSMGIRQNTESIIYNASNQLKEEERDELEMLEGEVSIFSYFEIHNLSLEKWSFFRVMNPKFDNETLFKAICQFSSEYINQLNFRALDPDETVDILGIKKKYIQHCNSITEGIIQFYDKVESKF